MKKYKHSIVLSSMMVTIFTILIKITGLIKHTIIANIIGATSGTDAFYISTGVLGQLAITIFSSLSITLLSMYTDKKEEGNQKNANVLINSAIYVFIPIAFFISIIVYICAPIISKFLAPTYSVAEMLPLVRYVRIMSISFIPCCYSLILNVILENEKEFIFDKCRGLFQNILVIFAALLFYNKYGVDALVYAFLIATIIHSALMTYKVKDKFSLHKNKDYTAVKKLIILTIPLAIGNTVYEINDIVDKQIAIGLGTGFTSLLTYGATINEMVTGVIVSSVSVVLFSNFTTWTAKKEFDKIEKNFIDVMNVLVFILIPVMIMCIFSGIEIVSFFYNNLDISEIKSIYYVLIGYAVGFIFQAARANLIKVLYAFKDTKTAMKNGIMAILINIILSIILSKYFGVFGISFATSLSMVFVTILLYKSCKKHLINLNFNKIIKGYYKYIISGLITSLSLYLINGFINFGIIINLLMKGIICIIVYIIILIFLKSEIILNIYNKVLIIYKNRIKAH